MKDYSKTIADAQAFIDSVKDFNGTNTSDSNPTRSDPFGGVDNSLQGDLNRDRSVPSSLPGKSSPDFSDRNLLDRPVGFPVINFSRKTEYDHPFRADLLTFIEVYYHENKKLPDADLLHEHFKTHPERPNFKKDWPTLLDTISESLSNRGIRPYNTTENYIDPKFAYAVTLVVNYLDKRTIPAKLKEAGISTKEWQAYLRRKKYFDYYKNRLDEVFDNDVKASAKVSLSRMVENGDLQAIKYYNELTNVYRPETQNAIQMVSIVLTAVMEILAQNVSSDILNRIAAEIRTSPSVRKIIEVEARS